MQIIDTVRNNIKKYSLCQYGDKLLIAVSGGPDSVALLHILYHIRHEWGLKLFVAHVNHHLRKGALRDQLFVKSLCASLDVPCYIISLRDIKSAKGSTEEIARKKRYAGLAKLAKNKDISLMALGHHQDDLAETVLMRILRGTGLLGLRAMTSKKEIAGMNVIRPLLNIKRSEIISLLKKKKIKYRTDPTNFQKYFYRNKVRLDLMPLLQRDYNPNIKQVLANLSEITAADYDFLWQNTCEAYKKICQAPDNHTLCLDLKPLTQLHLSQIRMLIRLTIDRLKGDTRRLTLKHLREIEDLIYNRPMKSIVHLPQSIQVIKGKPCLTFRKASK